MGAGNRCVLLMESPKSQSQMNAYSLKENKNILKSLTNRDKAEIVGVEMSSCVSMWYSEGRQTSEGKMPPSKAQIYAQIKKKKKKKRGPGMSQGPFFHRIRLKTVS